MQVFKIILLGRVENLHGRLQRFLVNQCGDFMGNGNIWKSLRPLSQAERKKINNPVKEEDEKKRPKITAAVSSNQRDLREF